MVDRRTFTAIFAGAIAVPKISFAMDSKPRSVFYSAVGPQLTLYSIDIDNATLERHQTVSTPANIQYAWPHPSKRYLYVVSSNGGPSASGTKGDTHTANVFTIDAATGTLARHGQTVMLPSRPIHTSVDISGQFLLIAYNDPSNLTVHHIKADGTIGERVEQTEELDMGIFAHQIRVTPDNGQVILVTRGNNAPTDNPVDPARSKYSPSRTAC